MERQAKEWNPNLCKPPVWKYAGSRHIPQVVSDEQSALNLGSYRRDQVSNVDISKDGRSYFDLGLRLLMSYQHEAASKNFFACLQYSPHTALAHGLVALCHAPNYNFRGDTYYLSTYDKDDRDKDDSLCAFPSQKLADRHSSIAIQKVEELKKLQEDQSYVHKSMQQDGKFGMSGTDCESLPLSLISESEVQLLQAIRILTQSPGIDPVNSVVVVGRPFSNAMRNLHHQYPEDPDIAYIYAESLMVLNAWQLYAYPSGVATSPDVDEIRSVLERSLQLCPDHAGLCHMYVHLSEMSSQPDLAKPACQALRTDFPHAGHLIHMSTHIDVLLGRYEDCVRFNCQAIKADRRIMAMDPVTAGFESFYFGYIVHDYHMGVYGAILGGMEAKAMEFSQELNSIVNEESLEKYPSTAPYLEAYCALDIHTMVRFGRWQELLNVALPRNAQLMLYRTASIRYARSLAFSSLGRLSEASDEADRFDSLRQNHPESDARILHNNSITSLLALDSVMMRGEVAYHSGKHSKGLDLLREAVEMQDNLNYDEPWGKMQPVRHALGGLLLEQSLVDEAADVFRKDLLYHPNNPWALVGLIECMQRQTAQTCCDDKSNKAHIEIFELKEQLAVQRKSEWADYNVTTACACCKDPKE